MNIYIRTNTAVTTSPGFAIFWGCWIQSPKSFLQGAISTITGGKNVTKFLDRSGGYGPRGKSSPFIQKKKNKRSLELRSESVRIRIVPSKGLSLIFHIVAGKLVM